LSRKITLVIYANRPFLCTWTVSSSTFTGYTYSTALSGADIIEIAFTNDGTAPGEDRNLFIDKIVVNGTTIQSEGGAAVIDKGWGASGFDGQDMVPGGEGLWWNGVLRFAVGPGAFIGGYDANGNLTSRVVNGLGYLLSYDAENRLVSVSGGTAASFVYDGDGGRKEHGIRVQNVDLYQNLASGAPVTSNKTLYHGDVITNGDAWANSGNGADREFAYTVWDLSYVQVDLGAAYPVDTVKVWHYAVDGRTYYSTRTQVSEDGVNWTTVFDSAVSGTYAETAAGKTHTFTTRSVRYVRDWLNGSTANTGNHWVEIEVWGRATTAYVGDYFEWIGSTNTMTQYYKAGGQTVAVRRGSTLNYLLADHLGSTSKTIDSISKRVLTEIRYKAWGEERYNSGAPPTSLRFTGQRAEAGLGLYFYKARWYDPYLNRWAQPDSIVPDLYNPLDHDRYSYVRNNPLKYIDPTGHNPKCGPDGMYCDESGNKIELHSLGRNNATAQAYEFLRQALFDLYGTGAVDANGKIKDSTLLALIIFSEFGSLSDQKVFQEALEALSQKYLYYCSGSCSINQQLNFLDGIQGIRGEAVRLDVSGSNNWVRHSGSAISAMNPNFTAGRERTSFEWGNVDHDSQMMEWINEGQGRGTRYVVNEGDFVVLTLDMNLAMNMNGWKVGTGPYWGKPRQESESDER
jgi:RHS repeat-associated protein